MVQKDDWNKLIITIIDEEYASTEEEFIVFIRILYTISKMKNAFKCFAKRHEIPALMLQMKLCRNAENKVIRQIYSFQFELLIKPNQINSNNRKVNKQLYGCMSDCVT